MSSNDKCWKRRPHDWNEHDETRTHLIKKCSVCKGLRWVARRTIVVTLTARQSN
ncbi:hypothetical protein LCGC14_0947860 [marine sediment metagenome]|uniref:Uncharacterized protein n=1 Tax=marine sediment metagenome TaxID=412755 RepID=A0A0F9P478_9ZZZZ